MTFEEGSDEVKVEDLLQKGNIVGCRINDLNLKRAILDCADAGKVDGRDLCELVLCEGLGYLENLIGDTLRRRCAICEVVLDADIVIRAFEVSTAFVQYLYGGYTNLLGCGSQSRVCLL